MQQNILKTSNITKIYLNYVDGKNYKRKEPVSVRYMDDKSCYFVGSTILNFSKPKWRTKAEIVVYTPDGIYNAVVIIRDVDFSLNNLFYKVDIPKTWNFVQLRKGTRKLVNLPVKLKFNDGVEISGETYDLSVGGFSLISETNLNTLQTRFACNCKIQFPNDLVMNFPDGILEVDSMYVRQKNLADSYATENQKLLCFKFLNLSADYNMIIKNFLMKIE